jgi:Xaa-Pro aminopeptidase
MATASLPVPLLRARRERVAAAVGAPVLLVGPRDRARNLPMNALPFRQDSSLWYLSGYAGPDAALLLHDGRAVLYAPLPDAEDALWHGPSADADAIAEACGVDEVRPFDLEALRRLAPLRPATIASPDAAVNALLASITGQTLRYGVDHGDDALVEALIAARRTKDAWEIAQMRRAAEISAEAHRWTMALTQPGRTEAALAAAFTAYLEARGLTPGYGVILTQRGEILHCHDHSGRLADGALLLLDGGGELRSSGYGADITRTWPVNGRFSGQQRAAYEAVLEAQRASLALCRPGIRYRDVHDASCRVLATFLVDEGLLRGSVDEVLARHAHALFFPHGVGHHLGLDVHDLENFGDRPSYPANQGRPEPFGTRNLRLDLPLEAGWVVTIEPGFYVVPAILQDAVLRERFADLLDPEVLERWSGFGGIRIEDDVHVTATGPDVLSAGVPTDVDAIEACVGVGATIEDWLG